MGVSNWNRWHDALLAENLTVAEHRLALALARLLLGWSNTEDRLGRALICQTAGNMDRRTFERARAGLVEKGLIRYEPGAVGKGHRGWYALVLTPAQKAAVERPNSEAQKAAAERPKQNTAKGRSRDHQKAALQRPRKERKGKTLPATPELQPLIAKAIDAYRGHGGSLELADRKPALIGQVATLARNGTDERIILAACADLGRTRTFPGHLKQRVEEIQAAGGPCHWNNNRQGLTTNQLLECGCTNCTQWAQSTPTAGVPA